jgi:hypothetical protein
MASAIVYKTGYTMDFTSQIEYAQRTDGIWFMRAQERGMKGYRWGAWKECALPGDRATEHPLPKAFRLPDPTGPSRAELAIEGKSVETCYTTPCFPVAKRSFGEFWLCLESRSVLCTIVRKTANAVLLAADGKETWVATKALITDERMAHVDGREVIFATIAPWATDTLAKFAE